MASFGCALAGLVVVVLVSMAVPTTALLVKAGDRALYFSEKNWMRNDTHAISVNSGAYLKTTWSGSAAAAIVLQPSKPGGGTHYMNVVFSVDNREYIQVPIYGNSTSIPLPLSGGSGGASADAVHTLTLFIYNSAQGANRWSDPAHGGASLIILGLQLDDVAIAVAPDLLPKRAVFFGDSITEGVNAECRNPAQGTGSLTCSTPGDLCANAATKTWGPAVAAAFNSEYSQVGFGSLGWVVGGAGGVPPFFVPGGGAATAGTGARAAPRDPAYGRAFSPSFEPAGARSATSAEGSPAVNRAIPGESSWDKIYRAAAGETATRTFDNIDYIFVLHATNDGLRGGSAAAVAASVQGWLAAVRAAAGPATKLFLTVPFGGFGSVNRPVGALKAGFDAYQKNASTADTNAYYIDLGKPAAVGLECGSWERGCIGAYGSKAGASVQGCDGIHPRGGTEASARHGELAAMLAVEAALAMSSA